MLNFPIYKSIDAAYICQTYSIISKQLIRDNLNVIVLFKQDDINLRHVFDENVSPEMSYENFKKLIVGTTYLDSL